MKHFHRQYDYVLENTERHFCIRNGAFRTQRERGSMPTNVQAARQLLMSQMLNNCKTPSSTALRAFRVLSIDIVRIDRFVHNPSTLGAASRLRASDRIVDRCPGPRHPQVPAKRKLKANASINARNSICPQWVSISISINRDKRNADGRDAFLERKFDGYEETRLDRRSAIINWLTFALPHCHVLLAFPSPLPRQSAKRPANRGLRKDDTRDRAPLISRLGRVRVT
jgi:hypothetical protein